jgi:hypothetical protein
MAGRENVGHRGVKCFGSVSGVSETPVSHAASSAALIGAHVVISFLQEWRLRGVVRGWRFGPPDRRGDVRPAAMARVAAGPAAIVPLGRLECRSSGDVAAPVRRRIQRGRGGRRTFGCAGQA